jgi:hypothetical protein
LLRCLFTRSDWILGLQDTRILGLRDTRILGLQDSRILRLKSCLNYIEVEL